MPIDEGDAASGTRTVSASTVNDVPITAAHPQVALSRSWSVEARRGGRAGMAKAPRVRPATRHQLFSMNSGLLASSTTRPLSGKRSARQTFRDELDLARVERLEEHGVDVSSPPPRRRASSSPVGPGRGGRAVRVPRLRGTRSGRGTSPLPMHVFQDDDGGCRRYCLEEASDRREELVRRVGSWVSPMAAPI